MKLTVVCEVNDSMLEGEGLVAYPEGMGNYLASFYKENGWDVTLILNDKNSDGSGLTDEIIDSTDVMVWWGHWHHNNILSSIAEKVVLRVNKGMGFIALHSAHHCRPFKRLMGTECHLSWREIGERERIWVIDATHPIAQGLESTNFVIPHEEMYGEPFDIPTPDEHIFLGWFQGGEVMRSGNIWKRGRGKVFFFQPGHETNPTFRQKEVQTILRNAAKYVMPIGFNDNYCSPHCKDIPEGDIVISD